MTSRLILRLRTMLGRCHKCWGPSAFTMVISSRDADDNELSAISVGVCRTHRDSMVAALTKVPHVGTANIAGIGDIRWESDGGDYATMKDH